MKENSHSLAYRIHDVRDILGISRSSIYNLIRHGRLKAVKIAGRTLILRSEIERLLNEAANDE